MGNRRYTAFFCATALATCGIAAPAHAMDQAAYDAAQSALASVFYDLEGNMIEKEAIEMNLKDLEPKGESIKARYADYNQRIQQHNSYCQGTFEKAEYERRLAQCTGEEGQLNDLVRQLDIERDTFQTQVTELQARDTRRQQAATPLSSRVQSGLMQLVTACMTMTLAEQDQLCHLPPAPGPRTAPIVDQTNAALRGELVKQRQ